MLIALFALILLVYWDLRSLVHHWQRQSARYSELQSLQRDADKLLDAIRALEHRIANAEGNIRNNFSAATRHTDNARADLTASVEQLRDLFRMEQQLMDDLLKRSDLMRVFVPRTVDAPVERKARYTLAGVP